MKVFNHLDLQLNQLVNALAEKVSTLPSASQAFASRLVYLTTDNTLYYCNGSSWIAVKLYTHPNHTGDVTSVADGKTTIANDVVTNAKLANMAANTLKGNNTSSAADPKDLTVAQVLSMLGVESGANKTTVDTAMSNSSTNPVQNKIVKAYIDDLLANLGSALRFKGTIGSSGATVTALPNSHTVGDTYLVSVAGTYAGATCEKGDMIICTATGTAASNSDWTVVQANWTAVKGETALSWGQTVTLATIGGVTIQAKLPSNPNTDTKVTSVDNHYTPEADQSSLLVADDGYYIKSISRDAKGHVTGINQKNLPPIPTSLKNPNSLTIFSKTYDGSAAVSIAASDVPTLNQSTTGNAGSATKLATARAIDGVSFNGTANITHYGACSTEAATQEKVVSLTGFTLATGAKVCVKFTYANTASAPTLNVNSTGAKTIRYNNSNISSGQIKANHTYEFVYDGTYWQLVGDLDTNTTYSVATTSADGLMSASDKTKLNNLTAGVRKASILTAGTSGSIRTNVSESSLPITRLGNVEFYAVSGERVWIDYTLSSNGTYMTIEWSSNIAITADTYYCVWIEGLV